MVGNVENVGVSVYGVLDWEENVEMFFVKEKFDILVIEKGYFVVGICEERKEIFFELVVLKNFWVLVFVNILKVVEWVFNFFSDIIEEGVGDFIFWEYVS